jgi:hypothetical protein
LTFSLPDENGYLECGLSAGVDPALSDALKLRIPTGTADITPNDRAQAAAVWAFRTFPKTLGADISETYVSCTYLVAVAGLMAVDDGDSIAVNLNSLLPMKESERAIIQPLLTVSKLKTALDIVVSTKINWWLTNHHTGQGALTGFALKMANKIFDYAGSLVPARKEAIMTLFHTCGHWCSTRLMITKFGIRGALPVREYTGAFRVTFAKDVQLRISSTPAGTHKHAIAVAGAKKLLMHLLSAFTTVHLDIKAVFDSNNLIKANPISYHVGATYLTGKEGAKFDDNLAGVVLGRVSTIILRIMPKTSLAASPHVQKENADVSKSYEDYDGAFDNLCQQFQLLVAKTNEQFESVVQQLYKKKK